MKIAYILTLCGVISAPALQADLMTVRDLKQILSQGEGGEIVATSYVQGVIEGMLGMDSLYQKEQKTPYEFCKLHESFEKGSPQRHPAYRTKEIVEAWERQGLSMTTSAVDMVLQFLTAQYGCTR